MAGAVAASSFQVSHRPPYNSARSTRVIHARADRGNQKKNFSGRSRASIASANSCAISASVSTTSTFIFETRTSIMTSERHDLHACIDEEAVAGHAPAQVARQEYSGVGDLRRVGVAPQRRPGLN